MNLIIKIVLQIIFTNAANRALPPLPKAGCLSILALPKYLNTLLARASGWELDESLGEKTSMNK